MNVTIPGLCFLTSSIPLQFDTDGFTTYFKPNESGNVDPDDILILSHIQAHQFRMDEINEISLYDSVSAPDTFSLPELYDGTQNLSGMKILIIMLNGWGDIILIQPALRNFYTMTAAQGNPPEVTLGCNWISNFPYPDVPYIHDVRPNIMTLKELCSFDFVINLIPVNFQKSRDRSMKDLCCDILKINPEFIDSSPPVICPDPCRVSRIRPVLDQIREDTGKKLLCLNWKSRFHHKNASPELFSQIATELHATFQAVLFKDKETSKSMDHEIQTLRAPIRNLSYLIHDYHDTVAALSLVDTFISVDTGIVHAAGAMGVPGVALFGPFPPETHVADYPSVRPVRAPFKGNACQEPCLETHKGCAELDYSATALSPCFQAIKADDVIRAFEQITTMETRKILLLRNTEKQNQDVRGTLCVS
jgi:ADP-heptose:LPS heptosyltransferase